MAFGGSLNQNEIFSAIYNMIISQTVNADIIGGMYDKLTDTFRVDGSEYGDTKLFYDVQLGHVEDWANDSEAANLLALQRPQAPNCTAITINKFKKIWLTVDNFMSKRAWGTEGAFGQFNSVILGTIRDTQRVYFTKLMNVAIGTTIGGASNGTKQKKVVNIPVDNGTTTTDESTAVTTTLKDTEALNRLEAQTIAKAIADVFDDLMDVSKDYNDLAYERSYRPEDFIIVWNQAYANKITKVDLPTIFHKDGLLENIEQYKLPAKYFGTISALTTSAEGACSVDEMKISSKWYRPGDVVTTGSTVAANSTYIPDAKVICKIIHKDAFKVMSSFETASEFYNPRALTQNHYLIFGFSFPRSSKLDAYPVITLHDGNF